MGATVLSYPRGAVLRELRARYHVALLAVSRHTPARGPSGRTEDLPKHLMKICQPPFYVGLYAHGME
ncbi:hypothetical protein [Glutamicibacter uratoxydans]|uniref:hypothetical protein n=1 Tax=Glutamicibacter uratoxydans TaxID=43667 RepID=UPI003D6DCF41